MHMQVVPVLLPHITKFSSVRLYLPKDLRSSDNRKVVRTQIQEVRKRFPDGLPQLDPVKDMHISDEGFKKIVQVYMGDEKEGRKKQASSNKQQGTAHPRQSYIIKMSCLGYVHDFVYYLWYIYKQCTMYDCSSFV